MSAEEEEARRIAEMGKPILGEHSRLEVVIEESYEFKVEQRFMDWSLLNLEATITLFYKTCGRCHK